MIFKYYLLILALLIGTVHSVPASQLHADEEITLSHKFTGKITDPNLKSLRPKAGIIRDVATWQKLWVGWRPNEPLKQIEFENELVIVNLVPGPNTVFVNTLKLDERGDLAFEVASTRMAGPGFGYLIMVVPKTKIKSVNGVPLDSSPTASVLPMTGNVGDSNQPNAESAQTAPETSPPVDTRAVGEEFVSVEIVGGIRTDIAPIGGETPISLIAANNIVWELDFKGNTDLLDAARKVDDSLARVNGKLSMKRGIDSRSRWIVAVESVEQLNLVPPPRLFPGQNNREVVNNRKTRMPNSESESTDQSSMPSAALATNDDKNSVPADAGQPGPNTYGFESITLATSDGQTQTINRDGVVVYESQAKNILNEWTVKQQTLTALHQFMADTNWAVVPRETRGKNSGEELSFLISIEADKSVSRIFVDASQVAQQPVLKDFFEIIRLVGADREK